MRNVPLAEVDALDRAVLAIGTDYPREHLLAPHEHRRAQVLYAATGLMRVETADGSWTVPTARAVLIPPATRHQVAMAGVSTRSLYIEPAAAPWFPARCQAVDVSALLLAAVDMEPSYAEHSRDGAVVASSSTSSGTSPRCRWTCRCRRSRGCAGCARRSCAGRTSMTRRRAGARSSTSANAPSPGCSAAAPA
jgi:mannose-6-phosphate isomerase-like protein (cupin superfamily)